MNIFLFTGKLIKKINLRPPSEYFSRHPHFQKQDFFALYMSKYLLDLNNSVICSSLPYLNDAKHVLLLTIYVSQICPASAAPRDAAIVNRTVNTRLVK